MVCTHKDLITIDEDAIWNLLRFQKYVEQWMIEVGQEVQFPLRMTCVSCREKVFVKKWIRRKK
jgi:hypothetical protein